MTPPLFKGTGPNFPDQDLFSLDDEQVKAVVLKLGYAALLSPTKETFLMATDDRHPTHRFIFVRYANFPNPSDNGFMMMGYRRSRHSFEQVKQYAHDLLEKNGVAPDSVKLWPVNAGGPQ